MNGVSAVMRDPRGLPCLLLTCEGTAKRQPPVNEEEGRDQAPWIPQSPELQGINFCY